MNEPWVFPIKTSFQGTYKIDGPTTKEGLHSKGFLFVQLLTNLISSRKTLTKVKNHQFITQAKFSEQLTLLGSRYLHVRMCIRGLVTKG